MLAELVVPTDRTPLSLWDWRVWSQARPTLWCYGDAGNLDPKRVDAPLLTHEWITAMCAICRRVVRSRSFANGPTSGKWGKWVDWLPRAPSDASNANGSTGGAK